MKEVTPFWNFYTIIMEDQKSAYSHIYIYIYIYIGRQHRKYIDLNLKPFRVNNNINNYIFHTKKNLQFKNSNKYLLYYYYINKKGSLFKCKCISLSHTME